MWNITSQGRSLVRGSARSEQSAEPCSQDIKYRSGQAKTRLMRVTQEDSPYRRHTFFFTKKKKVGKKEKNILACSFNYKLFCIFTPHLHWWSAGRSFLFTAHSSYNNFVSRFDFVGYYLYFVVVRNSEFYIVAF